MDAARELEGRVVAIAESRELDVFAALLERRGASVLRCPMVEIHDVPDPGPVLAWIEQASFLDDLILLTGEGLRRLLGCIDRHRPTARAVFVRELARVRKIVRGPKPGRALRELGLKPDVVAVQPTTPGVIESLRALEISGRRVGVQLYGSEPHRPLIDFLESAGARVTTVSPYVYADAAEEGEVAKLIQAIVAGQVDALAFTSLQQVERLARVAGKRDAQVALQRGLAGMCVAAVGPVVADRIRAEGWRVDLMPEDSYFMKPLASALTAKLKSQKRVI